MYCFLIPIYNHGSSIPTVIDMLKKYNLPCVVVNDGSNLETLKVLEGIEKKESWVTIVHLPINKGKGAAVKAGVDWALENGFSHIFQIDSDGQHNLQDVPEFLKKSHHHSEALILGQPVYDKSISKIRYYARYLTHFWIIVITRSTYIKDSMCGFRIYPIDKIKRVLEKKVIGNRMDFDPEISVRMLWDGVQVINIPTKVIYPENNISNFKIIKDNMLISKMHAKLFFSSLFSQPTKIPQEYQNRHWQDLQEIGSLWGIRFMLFVYRSIHPKVFDFILFWVLGYFFIFNHRARKSSKLFLNHVYQYKNTLGVEAAAAPKLKDNLRHFYNFGVANREKISCWLGELSKERLKWRNRQEFLNLIERKQGAIVLTSHLGNMEMMRAFSHDVPNLKINVLVQTKHANNFNSVLKSLNASLNVNLIEVSEISIETAIILKTKIDKGEFIAIAGDRLVKGDQNRHSIVPFLGKMAKFPHGPYILASMFDTPIYTLFAFKDSKGDYEIHFEKFSERFKLPFKKKKEVLDQYVKQYVTKLEHYTLKAPYQWFNFYDVWQIG